MSSIVRLRVSEALARAGLAGVSDRAIVAAIAVAVVLVGGVVVRLTLFAESSGDVVTPLAPEAPRSAEGEPPSETTSSPGVIVHIVGAVVRPGVYELPSGARVIDAIEAAGGLLGSAAPECVNLARILDDGEQVRVMTRDEATAASEAALGGRGGPVSGSSATGRVNLNTATVAQLEALPGVGPATAARIVEDRERNGPFRRVEDLMRVSGIGRKRFEALKDLITVR